MQICENPKTAQREVSSLNKKFRKLTQPGMAAYFVVMGLFCIAALVLEQLYLAIGEAVVTLLLLAGYQWANLRRRRALGISMTLRS